MLSIWRLTAALPVSMAVWPAAYPSWVLMLSPSEGSWMPAVVQAVMLSPLPWCLRMAVSAVCSSAADRLSQSCMRMMCRSCFLRQVLRRVS
ncbi:Uncharacterised protein [Neisseria gonorrhoeae]|uniref:Uncharacterized protein n=1 Tax=Neisseria gonorrhoeae TaxID=485 RepID=A0A378W238_NEIGO|nr:Uncharacterised protein [Neisseria gonorrhoeae]